MSKMKVLAMVTITALAACTKSPESKPDLPEFRLAESDRTKLHELGCYADKLVLQCQEPYPPQFEENQLKALNSQKNRLKKEEAAFRDVMTTIEASINAGKFDEASTAQARALVAALSGEVAVRTTKAAVTDVQILDEQNYQTVLGYNCEGSYAKPDAPFKTNTTLLNVAPQKALVRDDSNNYVSTLTLEGEDKQVMFRLVDAADAAKQKSRNFVQTDGEFLVQSYEIPSTMNCVRSRLAKSTSPFSDRVKSPESRSRSPYFECEFMTTYKGHKIGPNSHSFSVPTKDDRDRSGVEFVIEAVDDRMHERPEGRVFLQKYMTSVTWKDGLVKFAVENLETKKTAFEVTTTNTTKNLRIAVDDNAGNAMDITCTNK